MKPFNVMLAATLKDRSLLSFPLLGSVKLDGVRATVQRNARGKVVLLSRSNLLIPNMYCQQLFARHELLGLDGELIVGSPIGSDVQERTRSGVMKKAGQPDVTFRVFDMLPQYIPNPDRHGFGNREKCAEIAVQRARMKWGTTNLRVIHHPHELLVNLRQLNAEEESACKRGFEGYMVGKARGRYKHGRSTELEGLMLKLKRFHDAEAIIIGFEEQMENTNEKTTSETGKSKRSSAKAGKVGKNTLGAFVCRPLLKDGDEACNCLFDKPCKNHPIFNLGNGDGMTATKRKLWWIIRNKMKGDIVKYRYQRMTEDGIPFLPLWTGFRDRGDM